MRRQDKRIKRIEADMSLLLSISVERETGSSGSGDPILMPGELSDSESEEGEWTPEGDDWTPSGDDCTEGWTIHDQPLYE